MRPLFRSHSLKHKESSAGKRMCNKIIFNNTGRVKPITVNVPICLLNHWYPCRRRPGCYTFSPRLPVTMAEAKVGGSRIQGLRTILGTCSMEVPKPWAIKPLTVFRKLRQQTNHLRRTTYSSAPAAKPDRSIIIAKAALEMGAVSTNPSPPTQ